MTNFFEKFFQGKVFRRFILFVFLVIAFFSSFDIALRLHVLSFNLRFAQLLIFMLTGLFPFYFFYRKDVQISSALLFFFAWMLLQFLFLQNSVYLLRGAFYWIWLLSFGILILYAEDLGREVSEKEFDLFLRVYMLTFVIMAIFGLIQSLVPLLGIAEKGPFQMQTWKHLFLIGLNLPRINGFTYEPSYFVTYLLPAVPVLFYFSLHKVRFRLFWWVLLCFVAGMVVFSTARTGLFVLILVVGILFLYWILSRFPLRNYRKFYLFALSGIFLVLLIAALIPVTRKLMLWPLLYVSRDSSFTARATSQTEVFGIFFRNPFSGVSLGGVASARAALHHLVVDSNAVSKSFEASNVFAELLAASGLFGFFLFLLFQAGLFGNSLKLYRAFEDRRTKDLVFLLSFAVLVQLIMLFFNQNILRIYLWVNFAVLLIAQQVLKRKLLETH